jgi:hypothetical protein
MKFPEQRQELIETLQALSDRNYQESVWLKKEYSDRVIYDCLDYVIHFLFDDTSLADEPEKLIGYILANQEEVELIREVIKALDKLLSELGIDKTDAEYLSSILWNDVIKTAQKAYQTIKNFDRQKLLLQQSS